MPHNEKYQQMDIVFNTINEGIIITDKKRRYHLYQQKLL